MPIWNGFAESTMDLLPPDDFKEFLRLLTLHQIEYWIIGGYAVSFHGYPRANMDLDTWVGMTHHQTLTSDPIFDFRFNPISPGSAPGTHLLPGNTGPNYLETG